MNRKEFTQQLMAFGICPFAIFPFLSAASPIQKNEGDTVAQIPDEKEFVEHWLADLLESMERAVDRNPMVKIVEGCGKACFSRYQFKQEIAAAGRSEIWIN